MSTEKRVLITGITGFTGAHVREEFVSNGWRVFGLSRKSNDLKDCVRIDLLDPASLNEAVAQIQPQAVVHLAGISSPAHSQPIDFYNTHVQGTLNLLNALVACGGSLQKVLLASTANVYGDSVSGVFSESAPLKPFNDYGVSKLAMEYMSWLWRERLPIVIARPFNYSGVGQAKNFLLPKIVEHLKSGEARIELGNLHVRRDYSDVRNVARAYRLLVEAVNAKGAVNVCSGTAFSVRELVDLASKVAGRSLDVVVDPHLVREEDVDLLCGDHKKLEDLVGPIAWIPMQDTIRWMLAADEASRS